MNRGPTTNIFDVLSDDAPKITAVTKPTKDEAVTKTAPKVTGTQQAQSKQIVGGTKPGNQNRGTQGNTAARGENTREVDSFGRGGYRGKSSPQPPRLRKEFNKDGATRTRGGRGGGGSFRGRQFDRSVSGTGRPRTENKKSGDGSHNWGGLDGKQLKEEFEEGVQFEATEETEAPKDEEVKEGEVKEEESKEPEELSYEDFLAQKAEKAKALQAKLGDKPVEARKVDASEFAKMTALKPKRLLDEKAAEQSSSTGGSQGNVRGPKQVPITQVFRVVDNSDRTRGDRGGRGRGGRGRGGRGGRGGDRPTERPAERPARRQQRGPDFDATAANDHSFPALNATS